MVDFQTIPYVGIKTEEDFIELGYTSIADLKSEDPEAMYQKLMKLRGCHIDRCQLYVFRMAVYYANGGRDKEKLKWWNWKDNKSYEYKNYKYKKKISAIHFGDDDIVIGDYRFNPINMLSDFPQQKEFDFYLDTNNDIYICRFNSEIKEPAHVPNEYVPIDYLIVPKINASLEDNLNFVVEYLKSIKVPG